MRRQIDQRDGGSLICRNACARWGILAERIVEFHHTLVQQFHQHFAGHQLGQGCDADDGIQLWMNVITWTRFAKTAKHALVAVDDDHRHARRATAVVNEVCVAIGNI